MGVEEQIHEHALDRLAVVPDLVVARRRFVRSRFQPVQGRLAGEWRAIPASGFQLPGQRRHHPPAFHTSKIEQCESKLCHHQGSSLKRSKSFSQNNFYHLTSPRHLHSVRNAG